LRHIDKILVQLKSLNTSFSLYCAKKFVGIQYIEIIIFVLGERGAESANFELAEKSDWLAEGLKKVSSYSIHCIASSLEG
jgi:hypothetical protein